jgi:formylglycine-generating enzyme required for sulfatase activity
MHSAGERDDMPRADMVAAAARRLADMGRDRRLGGRVIEWLLDGAGILRSFGAAQIGFFHLGMQEFLSAAYIAATRGAEVEGLARSVGESWWQEVTRLLVALPNAGMFGPLVERLLAVDRGWTRHVTLINQWIDESPSASAAPFLGHLDHACGLAELSTLLSLLERFAGDEQVQARARGLASDLRPLVAAGAARLLATQRAKVGVASGGKAAASPPLALLFREDQREAAERLVVALEAHGFLWMRGASGELMDGASLCGEELDRVGREAAGIVVVADSRGAAFDGLAGAASAIEWWATEGRLIFGAWIEGAEPRWPEEAAPEQFPEIHPWQMVRAGAVEALVEAIQRALGAGAAVAAIVKEAVFFELETGIRALGVPGGRFRMGMRRVNAAGPVRWVKLSPYWLGETPVTNLQYERFLVANPEHRRPMYWKDERFEGDTRPVIGVSWDDAVAFCAWLSGLPGVKGAGLRAVLPSEAQWEFAARGDDERRYPWGKERPSERLAVFARRGKGVTTAPVGSCPKGAGPFGHLDLVGNVWEWCRDVWHERAYELRADEAHDPVNEEGDLELRSIRGDCWYSDELWAAAERAGLRSWRRNDSYGFRVGFEPASP